MPFHQKMVLYVIDGLPLGLRYSLEAGECVLFIGAGIGSHLKGPNGQPAPDASSLAKELAEAFSIDTTNYELSKISQIVQLRKGRTELESFIRKRLGSLEPDENFRWLFTLRWKAIFTTNYDGSIQRAYDINPTPLQRPITISSTSDLVEFDRRFEVPIYHLHGTVFDTSKSQLVITEDDYLRFRDRRNMLFELLKKEFATSTFLYIGYSNRDPNWKFVFNDIKAEFLPSSLPQAYRLAPGTDALDREILKAQGVETIDGSIDEFVEVASSTISEQRTDTDRLSSIRSKVPPDLIDAFEKNPAPTARLLSSWSYVNQAPFNEKPNVPDFLHGDRANWGLVGNRIHFERDIEEEVFDSLLDYATSSSKRPKFYIVLGPAGYGTSTLLMSLAAKLVNERAGPVFWHTPNSAFREGDVEYATSIVKDRPFFIVDNAADNVSSLLSAFQRLADIGKSACFLLGDRLNEWRQSPVKLKAEEFVLEHLSDPEIHRLIKFLDQNNGLGILRDLDENLRLAAIKEKHQKELLVVMREATEGKAFDAILEDEYRGISNAISRDLYLTVSCFHQHNAPARDTLLADLLKVSVEELYSSTRDATQGVVIFDCIDETYGRYTARTRHRLIAQVIWERCGNPSDRERLLLSALNTLNLNYRSDREAFDHFVQSDRMVDSIRTLEGKTQYFDTASRKDPENPYVKQHYARMLLREKRIELALGQIEQALKINPASRVLRHTKGIILSQMALQTESIEIARKRLVQSEDEFRRCIAAHNRDDYSYQGLAELFLGWAKRIANSEEATTYVSKAEEVINEGLKVVRNRDSLWLVSSNIQKWLGDQPAQLKALEKAVSENPGSVIAPYLLGRAYRRGGQVKKALEVLKALVSRDPNEFRPIVEYALALVEDGEVYSKAIAVLNLSTLYGLSDPRFVATLGGMLFMNNDFTAASKIFTDSIRQEFPATESQRIQFRPCISGDRTKPLRLPGKVTAVKAGFAFIRASGYPDFFCPASKFSGLVLKSGLQITFEPAFSARGQVADSLRLA